MYDTPVKGNTKIFHEHWLDLALSRPPTLFFSLWIFFVVFFFFVFVFVFDRIWRGAWFQPLFCKQIFDFIRPKIKHVCV